LPFFVLCCNFIKTFVMPEVVIKYKKPETLKILKGLAKYFDFKVSTEKKKAVKVNGVTVIPGDESIDISDMEALFSAKSLDAKELRKKAWQRTK